MRFKITTSDAAAHLGGPAPTFPKYTTQLLNLANQNAQATRPPVVGKMSDLIVKANPATFEEWREWYLMRHPDAIATATDRISGMLRNLGEALKVIDDDMVRRWVEDLVLTKTFGGLRGQNAILPELARRLDMPLSPASSIDEGRGVDGWLGSTPVQVKPETYRKMRALPEERSCPVVYYWKDRSHFEVDATELVTELRRRAGE